MGADSTWQSALTEQHSLQIKHSLYCHIYFFCNIMKRSLQEVIILSHGNASSLQKTKHRAQLLHAAMKPRYLFAKIIAFLLWNHFILETVFFFLYQTMQAIDVAAVSTDDCFGEGVCWICWFYTFINAHSGCHARRTLCLMSL